MGAYQSHSSIAHPKMMLVTTYLINHGAIQVNQKGRRFGDETDSYAGHALAIQAQPDRSVVEVFDEGILKQTLASSGSEWRETTCLRPWPAIMPPSPLAMMNSAGPSSGRHFPGHTTGFG
jgi:hypothetical protein